MSSILQDKLTHTHSTESLNLMLRLKGLGFRGWGFRVKTSTSVWALEGFRDPGVQALSAGFLSSGFLDVSGFKI